MSAELLQPPTEIDQLAKDAEALSVIPVLSVVGGVGGAFAGAVVIENVMASINTTAETMHHHSDYANEVTAGILGGAALGFAGVYLGLSLAAKKMLGKDRYQQIMHFDSNRYNDNKQQAERSRKAARSTY
ncbi:hypothetical protein H7Y63_02575 [Polaromonas sp.]|nr:hypothetical protein [Candidatus Saccharibacteria bacterium]